MCTYVVQMVPKHIWMWHCMLFEETLLPVVGVIGSYNAHPLKYFHLLIFILQFHINFEVHEIQAIVPKCIWSFMFSMFATSSLVVGISRT